MKRVFLRMVDSEYKFHLLINIYCIYLGFKIVKNKLVLGNVK